MAQSDVQTLITTLAPEFQAVTAAQNALIAARTALAASMVTNFGVGQAVANFLSQALPGEMGQAALGAIVTSVTTLALK